MSDFELDADLEHAARHLADVVFRSQSSRPALMYLADWMCTVVGTRVVVQAKDCRRGGLGASVEFDLPSPVADRDLSATSRRILDQFMSFRKAPTSAPYVCEDEASLAAIDLH